MNQQQLAIKPPSDLELEQLILGEILSNSKLFPEKTNLDSNKHRVLNETVKRPVVD